MLGRSVLLNRRALLVAASTAPLAAHRALAEDAARDALPAFLPDYFSQVMTFDGAPLTRVQSGVPPDSASYMTADGSAAVLFVFFTGVETACDAEFASRSAALLTIAGKPDSAGKVTFADEFNLRTEAQTDKAIVDAALFRMPFGVLTATVFRFKADQEATSRYQEGVGSLVDRWRYELASGFDSTMFGRWARPAHDYARELLTVSDRTGALAVLQRLSLWAPYDLKAKVELAELTTDPKARAENASVAYERTEDVGLRSRAALLLGRKGADLASLPILRKGEAGLQLVLLPLTPCDLTLVSEAAVICRKILDVPINLKRMLMPWSFGPPDRIWRQRTVDAFIHKEGDPNANLDRWTTDQYANALLSIAAKKLPLEAYEVRQFVEELRQQPGSIDANPSLDNLQADVKPYHSGDPRTVFIGVTGMPIYLGISNYAYSAHRPGPNACAILSYDMMLSKNAGDAHESRPRAAERLAKEMVPPFLAALAIERPIDPADPGSYSDGAGRLDEKSLTLSAPTREALNKIRHQQP